MSFFQLDFFFHFFLKIKNLLNLLVSILSIDSNINEKNLKNLIYLFFLSKHLNSKDRLSRVFTLLAYSSITLQNVFNWKFLIDLVLISSEIPTNSQSFFGCQKKKLSVFRTRYSEYCAACIVCRIDSRQINGRTMRMKSSDQQSCWIIINSIVVGGRVSFG